MCPLIDCYVLQILISSGHTVRYAAFSLDMSHLVYHFFPDCASDCYRRESSGHDQGIALILGVKLSSMTLRLMYY
jgi:hypothetical protein